MKINYIQTKTNWTLAPEDQISDLSSDKIWCDNEDYALLTGNVKVSDTKENLLNQIKKLQSFKDYVHLRLDAAGIEQEPNGEHSEHGCRIGDRLDIVLNNNVKNNDIENALRSMLKKFSFDPNIHDSHDKEEVEYYKTLV